MFTIKGFTHLTNTDDHSVCHAFQASSFKRNNKMGWLEIDGKAILTVSYHTLDVGLCFPDHSHYAEFDKIIVENMMGKTIDVLHALNVTEAPAP